MTTTAVALIEFTMVQHWLLSLVSICAFTLVSFILDNKRLAGGGRNVIVSALRIYAKNVKMFFRIILGVGLILTLVYAAFELLKPRDKAPVLAGGPESEKFYGFMNTVTGPMQFMVNVGKNWLMVLSAIFLVCLYGAGKVVAFSPMLTLAIIVTVYLAWLVSVTTQVVREEYGQRASFGRGIIALVPAQLTTWFLFIVFLGAMQTGFHWLVAQIPA